MIDEDTYRGLAYTICEEENGDVWARVGALGYFCSFLDYQSAWEEVKKQIDNYYNLYTTGSEVKHA